MQCKLNPPKPEAATFAFLGHSTRAPSSAESLHHCSLVPVSDEHNLKAFKYFVPRVEAFLGPFNTPNSSTVPHRAAVLVEFPKEQKGRNAIDWAGGGGLGASSGLGHHLVT